MKHFEISRVDLRIARTLWGKVPPRSMSALRLLIANFGLSIALGDLLYLDGGWYVTHAGLVRLATRKHCSGIHVNAVREFCDPSSNRWGFKATVYKSVKCRG